jgi:outer membrane lipoprotein-sorting protein
MKIILSMIVLLYGLIPLAVSGQTMSATDIIRKADEKTRGKSSSGILSMTIERPGWSRTVEMKTWSLGTEYSMIYILSPAREKGQVFLKRGTEMWNWVPGIERMIKIPPSMMMQSWMGSDFTNDDLVRESSVVKYYTHKLLGRETVRETECYKINLSPKEEAPVVWGKIITWITTDSYDTWKVEFYDEDGSLVSTQNSYKPLKMGDRVLPTEMVLVPADKPGQRTVLTLKEMKFDQPLQESFFSQQNMKKIR